MKYPLTEYRNNWYASPIILDEPPRLDFNNSNIFYQVLGFSSNRKDFLKIYVVNTETHEQFIDKIPFEFVFYDKALSIMQTPKP